jgi:hypothetical protein
MKRLLLAVSALAIAGAAALTSADAQYGPTCTPTRASAALAAAPVPLPRPAFTTGETTPSSRPVLTAEESGSQCRISPCE